MNTIANYIRISDLPYYVKTGHRVPELNCSWSSADHCSFPFIIAATGNIATAESFPFNRHDYRRTGNLYHFPRLYTRRGLHQLSYTFEILEEVSTGKRFAIIRDVIRGDQD